MSAQPRQEILIVEILIVQKEGGTRAAICIQGRDLSRLPSENA
jgi:hypothetical protein